MHCACWQVGELIKKIKIDKGHLLSGTDESGNRLKFFSATDTCQRARAAGLHRFVYEGETVESDLAGLKLPGKLRHGEGSIQYEYGASYVGQCELAKGLEPRCPTAFKVGGVSNPVGALPHACRHLPHACRTLPRACRHDTAASWRPR